MIPEAWQLKNAATIQKLFYKITVQKKREESQQTENFEIINNIHGCEKFLGKDIFEWLDVENNED